jgi:ribonuclease P protein component
LESSDPQCSDRRDVTPEKSLTFGRTRRLRRRGEFQQVFDKGQRMRGRFLTVLYAPGRHPQPRLGIVASRKLGDAVRRNRAKRLIREVFRRWEHPAGMARVDIVVIPRTEIFETTFAILEQDYRTTVARCAARRKHDSHPQT